MLANLPRCVVGLNTSIARNWGGSRCLVVAGGRWMPLWWLVAEGQGWGAACFSPAWSCALDAAWTLEELKGFSRAHPRLKMLVVHMLVKISGWHAVKRQLRWQSLESKTLIAYLRQSIYSAFWRKCSKDSPRKHCCATSCAGVEWNSEAAWPSVPARLLESLCWELLNCTILPLLTTLATLPCLILLQARVWEKARCSWNYDTHNITEVARSLAAKVHSPVRCGEDGFLSQIFL